MMQVEDLLHKTTVQVADKDYTAGYEFSSDEYLSVAAFCNRVGGYRIAVVKDGQFRLEAEPEADEATKMAAELEALKLRIADLQAEMATAQLNGDAAWVSELQDQYNALINGGDE